MLEDFGVLLGVGGLYRGLPVAMGWGGSQEAARGGNRSSTARVIPGGSRCTPLAQNAPADVLGYPPVVDHHPAFGIDDEIVKESVG